MNDDLQSFIEPELEARLVALILEEASAFEVEELERILKERPEVALAKQRLEEAHGLLGQAMKQPDDDGDWKLSTGRRENVLAVFDNGISDLDDTAPSKDRSISIAQWRSIYATAACLMVAVVVLALVGPMKNQIPEGESALVSYSDGREFLEEDIRGQEDMLHEMQAKIGNDNDSRLAASSRYEENALANSEKTAKEYLADIDAGLGAISPDDALATIELHNRQSKNQNLAGLDGLRNSRSESERTKLKRAVSIEGENLDAVAALGDKELMRADGEKSLESKSKSFERDERWSGRAAKTKPAKKSSSSMAQLVPANVKPSSIPKVIAANSTSSASIPVPPSADPFSSESSGRERGTAEGQADPFAAGDGDKALKSSSTSGKGYAGGVAHFDDRSTEAKDRNTSQQRKALPKNGEAVDGSVRSADINSAVSLEERMVEKRDSPTDVPVDRTLLKPREFSSRENESWKMEKAKGEASTNVEEFVTEIRGFDVEEVKKEKDSKSRLLGMDFSDERFEGEVNPGSFSRKSGLAAKIDRFSEQDKAAPGQVVGGIVSGGLRIPEPSITTKNMEGSEFSLAKGLRDLGRFDAAEKEFKEALQKDPASKEARRGLARIASEKSDYYRSSYDETRARMLQEVDKTWELAIPSGDAQAVVEESKEDDQEIDLEAITSSETADIVTRRFEVPENLGAFLSSNGGAAESDDDSFATPEDNGGSGIKARQPIVDLLKRQGVVFIDGTSASLLTDSGSLVVRNTPSQLELVDAILAASVQDAEKKKAEKEARKLAQQKRVNFETLTTEKSDSTFSLNVSDVSFKLAKSSLLQGKWPGAAKVRPEEFVNALNYDDRKPSQSEKVACEIEQGAHPFMQQRNLMRVSMSTAALGRNASTPLRLTILLDQSGSMERADRAESVKRAFALLADQLNAGDEITLVGFARTPRLLAERVKGNESKKLLEIVSQPITEGGTNLEGALDSGIQLAKQQFVDGAQNRIILLTDGAANLGDALPANLAKQVEKMRQAGIAFDACGVGADGLNDEVLSSLAKQGDGRYYFLDRPEDADDGFARQIAGALRPAAKNVKVQVIFNPRRVSKFKLYGFEKHLLKKEDFRNDTVDAAEMAAEESGVALYHFEALPEGEGDVGHVSVRFLDTATEQMVERKWNIPFEEDVTSFTDSDPALRLAGTAALFAEKLKGSAVGERVQLKELRKEADSLQGSYQSQARFQELRTMLQQAGE